jgi:hypothetical protein
MVSSETSILEIQGNYARSFMDKMTNKQDEGMTIEKAKEILAKDRQITTHHRPEFCHAWRAIGFIEGWDARGVKDAEIIQQATPGPLTEKIAILMMAMMYWKDEILKLQSEGEK